MSTELQDILVVSTAIHHPESTRDTIRATVERELIRLGVVDPKVLVVPNNITLSTIKASAL